MQIRFPIVQMKFPLLKADYSIVKLNFQQCKFISYYLNQFRTYIIHWPCLAKLENTPTPLENLFTQLDNVFVEVEI